MTRHLKRVDLVLYVNNIGLALEQRDRIERHLEDCDTCRRQLAALQQQMRQIASHNLSECQTIQRRLPAFLDGELTEQQAQAIKEHLNGCDRCQQLYHLATELPAWEAVATAEVEVPTTSLEKIEATVFSATKQASPKATVKKATEKITTALEGMIADFILSFRPIQPAAVFRGNGADELKVIEHPGGDLHLATGLKNVTLELTSIFEEFTLRAQTDEKGEIVFENLAKGEYIATVSGYRLTEVKVRAAEDKTGS
ncbi:MAG: zf-HC2 domain-containing protein [candidate division KSB1 bacterium]|nr:zf-HC2 domain-containing protein [candidate division KSB1 bacterium]